MAVRFAANHVGEAWRVVSLSERKGRKSQDGAY